MAVAIFDGSYLLHRVMHVPQLRMLATKEGKPTGGTFGFIKSLRSTVSTWSEIRRIVVVFDGGRSRRRMELFADYKNRPRNEDVDPDGLTYLQKYHMQMNYLRFALPRLGVKVVKLPGREGDDLVGLLARELDDTLKIVVSDDKDMYQLVDEDVHVWRPLREERITMSNFEEMVGCKKEHFLIKKSCLGDGSDTIPGIKGVGPKTVDKVLEYCPDVGEYPYEAFFEACMDLRGKKFQSIFENIDTVLRNYKLVDIALEEFTQEEKSETMRIVERRTEFDVLAVKRVFVSLEFFSLVENFSQWVTPFQMLR